MTERRSEAKDGPISVTVTRFEGGLSVVWEQDQEGFDRYFPNEDLVLFAASEVREVLRAFVDDHLTKQGKNSRELLKTLASRGADLRNALFEDKDSGHLNTAEIQDWLIRQPLGQRIAIRMDVPCHLPWSLVYMGDPKNLNEGESSIRSLKDFWCLRFSLSTVYSRKKPTDLENPRSRDGFKFLPILDKTEYEKSTGTLTDKEKSLWEDLLKHSEPIVHSEDDCFNTWKSISGDNSLLYFYTHSDGTRLKLDDEKTINVPEFARRFTRPVKNYDGTANTYCLTFLNGCSSAVGEGGNSFLLATATKGFCGFIGTEAPIPTRYAFRFGMAFLSHLLDGGKPPHEIIDKLRREHWPLSLVYGNYCQPKFVVEPAPKPAYPCCLTDVNYSTEFVGDETMSND